MSLPTHQDRDITTILADPQCGEPEGPRGPMLLEKEIVSLGPTNADQHLLEQPRVPTELANDPSATFHLKRGTVYLSN